MISKEINCAEQTYTNISPSAVELYACNKPNIQGVSKKSRQFRNGSQPREAASSMKFFVNIDCLGTCDVE